MRRPLAILLCLTATPGLAAETCATATPDENIALAKQFYVAMNTRSPEMLESVLSEAWEDIPLPPGQAPGRAGMQQQIQKFGTVFKDFRVVNDEFIVSGNQVVVRSTAHGVHTGTFAGIPATGKAFAMTSIDIHTVCNGRIVQSRHLEDWLATLVQIGFLPLNK